jgi:hypothetical protein
MRIFSEQSYPVDVQFEGPFEHCDQDNFCSRRIFHLYEGKETSTNWNLDANVSWDLVKDPLAGMKRRQESSSQQILLQG